MVARCKPLTKDHLPLKTAFAGTNGWSLVTGFTVPGHSIGDADRTNLIHIARLHTASDHYATKELWSEYTPKQSRF